jgi:peptide/nickel transport system substrate-binding protein
MDSIHHRREPTRPADDRFALTRRDLLAVTAAGLVAGAPAVARAAGPQGQLTWAIHVSVPPTWLDPADTLANGSPFMLTYALHDAMVKPMPDKVYSPSLAESWSKSEDDLTYEFVLRQGVNRGR